MKHWRSYIEKQKPEFLRVSIPDQFAADIIVVIPCYNEPGLFETLYNLRVCDQTDANVLILIVFNTGVLSCKSAVAQNRLSYNETLRFAEMNNQPGLSFMPVIFEDLPRKHAGVGLARKIGMDLAVKHFLETGNSRGVIVSLDADCTVSPNFFVSVRNAFLHHKRLNATVHQFEHRVEGGDILTEDAARQYEAYIRYFSAMLQKTGFPYYWHTIGSTFAVAADAYVRVGGMGRQQGGEDFYFLQKVFALGNILSLNNTKVFPLARVSDRVPFGTGPSLQRIIDEPDGNIRAYSESSFFELKKLFDVVDLFYNDDLTKMDGFVGTLHPTLQDYLADIGFTAIIRDCKENSASLITFRKRFFHHFNAFRIIKYLNEVHPFYFPYESFANLVDKYKK